MKSAVRWHYCVDPQHQANRFLRYSVKGLLVHKVSHPRLSRILEECLHTGAPTLLEDHQGPVFPPSVRPLLVPRPMAQVGGRPSVRLVRVGRREMEVPETFRCYVTTAIGNPHLLPEVTTNVTESARAHSYFLS